MTHETQKPSRPLCLLRYHVTGAIERGEAEAITEKPALDFLEAIKTHGLMVRQLPQSVKSTYESRHFEYMTKHKKENETISPIYKTEKGQAYFDVIRIPDHAGFWLCKQAENTGTLVRWSLADNLAPTLETSILRCIKIIQN